MPSGPKPKAAELRQKQGTLRPDRTPELVIFDPLGSAPEPPESLDAIGRDAWVVTTEALVAAGALQRQYLPLILMFAECVSLFHRAREELKDQPLVRQGRGGGVNPNLRIIRDMAAMARSIGEQIGASPVAMARLGLAQVKGLSLSEELAARRKG